MQPLICKSTAMQKVARLVGRAARADCPVFVWGEAGSGKKAVAETIHHESPRGHRPLVVFDAGRPTRESLEDAICRGAEGGTLLINNVSALSLTDQAKLLRVAESVPSQRREGLTKQTADFRLMATSQCEVLESVRRGMLREDLGYRLAVVTILVPPLRQRQDDIPRLVEHFLAQWSAAHDRPVPEVSPDLMRRLTEHSWPGNARQLRDCLDKMLSAKEATTLEVGHFPISLLGNGSDHQGAPSQQQVGKLADLERSAMMRALEVHDGNRTQAARALGISVRTLQRKLRHWGG